MEFLICLFQIFLLPTFPPIIVFAIRALFPVRRPIDFFPNCILCRFIRSRIHFHFLRSEVFPIFFSNNTRSNSFRSSLSMFVSRTALQSFLQAVFGPIVFAINRFFSFCGTWRLFFLFKVYVRLAFSAVRYFTSLETPFVFNCRVPPTTRPILSVSLFDRCPRREYSGHWDF